MSSYVVEILQNLEKIQRRALRQISFNVDSAPWKPVAADEELFDWELDKHQQQIALSSVEFLLKSPEKISEQPKPNKIQR